MGTSAAFGPELDALGVWRPHGDGDALRELASIWTETADLIEELHAVLRSVVALMSHHHHGKAATAFAEMWKLWDGDTGYLPTTVADCRTLAAAAGDFGTDVDVADRTLTTLVEQAFAEAATALGPAGLFVLLAWLLESADVVRNNLDGQATRHADVLSMIPAISDPKAPNRVDPRAIDPTLVAWRDPGTPVSLGNLGTAPVDFGAGPGVPAAPRPPTIGGSMPPSTVPPITAHVPTAAPPVAVAAVPATPSTNTITINGNGNTVNIGGGGLPTIPTITPKLGTKIDSDPPTRPPKVDAVPLARPKPIPAFSGGGGSAASFHPMPTPAPLDLAPLGKTTLPDRVPAPVSIAIKPPVTEPVLTASPQAVAGATAAVAGAVASKSAGKGGFMPMMPMGAGGATGDEAPEPKRRSSRK